MREPTESLSPSEAIEAGIEMIEAMGTTEAAGPADPPGRPGAVAESDARDSATREPARTVHPQGDAGRPGRGSVALLRLATAVPLTAVLAVAAVLRFWRLTAVGLNSDEAVYTGTAASLAGNSSLGSIFPVFRAHPVLFQALLSLVLRVHLSDWTARAVPAAIGVAAVAMTYGLGARLYDRKAGLAAALLLAVMPYHVVVSRQVLLDGTMTLCATAALYCVVRFVERPGPGWLLAAGGMMGVTVLAKETSVILLGGLYAFFALTPAVRMRWRQLLPALGAMTGVAAASPLALALADRSRTGGAYLLWQLFRRPNHPWTFYFTAVPSAVGPLLLVAVGAGLIWLRRENTWRERLLLSWIGVPVLFFTIWPVKGFQYLLPIAPPLAVLAGRTLGRLPSLPWPVPRRVWLPRAVAAALTLAVTASLGVSAWQRAAPSHDGTFLAGSGGLPGGREAGTWLRGHAPDGVQLLVIGPSMGNVLQFYGHRRVRALSVSPDPRARNPSYEPVANADRALRDGEFQYVVWDSYSAKRTPFFTGKAQRLINRYHGRAVFTARGLGGKALVVIYQVRAT
ncbi:ArnT family glycosyltransferase [Streptomyces sp. NPDC050743]|uniref:ArnT family glycosyltransferase n=1 Tax=Streptomyces sp. NPDC050743 TaxID=3365634 RepID=UPI0037A9172B